MADTERSFTVTTPPATVLEYLKDFSHTEEWDPGTRSCVRIGTGPVEIGSTWHNVSTFAGRETSLIYTLRDAGPKHLTFVGENKSATSTDQITLTPHVDGTRVDYHAHIEFHGLAKLGAPLVKPILERLADRTQEQMVAVLNALAVA